MARNATVRSTLPPIAEAAPQTRPEMAEPPTTISLAGPSTPHQEAVGARTLQAMITKRLNGDVAAEAVIDDRWNTRGSATFILCSSLGLWGVIAATLMWLRC